ncbi:transcription factor GTE1 isoform X2 [Tanacetum coccineum]
MEAKHGTGYKSVRDVCAYVRLIFKNAMKYNDEKDNVHVMAKTLMDERRKKEDAEAQLDMQLTHELNEVDLHLKKLKEVVLSNCSFSRNWEFLNLLETDQTRKISFEEKQTLVKILTKLSPDDLQKALLIVAQNSPNFEAACNEVELDIDTQVVADSHINKRNS